MESLKRVRKTELSRNVRQVINSVQRGQTVIVENHGQPEVAIIDVLDYYIMRAFAHYHTNSSAVESGGGLREEAVAEQPTIQARYDLVLSYYLANEISLSRAAELLDMLRLDLQTRFIRLELPIHISPLDQAEAEEDVAQASAWTDSQ